jgi:putative salt-induced outer membrane protein
MKKILFLMLVAFALYAENIHEVVVQEDIEDDQNKSFIVHLEMGYNQTTGNTQTQNFSLDGKIKKQYFKHNFKIVFDSQYSSDDNNQTANKYKIVGDYLYQLYEDFSYGYLVGYKVDHFSGFNYQFVTGPLMEYKAYKSDDQNLTLSLSGMYSIDEVKEDLEQLPPVYSKKIKYPSIAVAFDYVWQMLENLKFTQYASFREDISQENRYFIFSKSAVASKISTLFSMGVSYKVDYVSQPPQGKKNTDTTLLVSLIMDY